MTDTLDDDYLLVSIRVLVGIAQERTLPIRSGINGRVSIRVLVGIAQERCG